MDELETKQNYRTKADSIINSLAEIHGILNGLLGPELESGRVDEVKTSPGSLADFEDRFRIIAIYADAALDRIRYIQNKV